MNYNFNGTIQQNGQALSGGGIYEHVMIIKDKGNSNVPFRFICSVKDAFSNAGDFLTWLKSVPYSSSHLFVAMFKPEGSNSSNYNQIRIRPWTNYADIYWYNTANSTSSTESTFSGDSEISDTVYEL